MPGHTPHTLIADGLGNLSLTVGGISNTLLGKVTKIWELAVRL